MIHVRKHIGIAAGFFVAAAIGACSAHPESVSQEPAEFTKTVVNRRPDGTETVSVVKITAAQQQAEQKARQEHRAKASPGATYGAEDVGSTSEAITVDTGCSWESLEIFDAANCTGNVICFNGGSGTVFLGNYCRGSGCGQNWSAATRSFWPGNNTYDPADDGYFYDFYHSNEQFYVNQYCTNSINGMASYNSTSMTFTD